MKGFVFNSSKIEDGRDTLFSDLNFLIFSSLDEISLLVGSTIEAKLK